MGWTGTLTNRPAHELVTEELEYGGAWKVIARSGRYYVIEHQDPEHEPHRLAVVALVNSDIPQYKGADRWVYTKLVSEDMGPCEYACPDKLLDMLDPEPPNEYAAKWRERCRAYNAAKRAQPKIKPGDVIELAEAITFQNGMNAKRFIYEGRFNFLAGGWRVRLPKDWKTRYEWKVVTSD